MDICSFSCDVTNVNSIFSPNANGALLLNVIANPIVLLFIFVLGIYLVMKHHDKDKCNLSIFNKGANLVFIVFSILIGLITFNFSNTFTMFHKIFFSNDYWLFDYRTDPVILALPEELFMILSVIIIIILFIVCLAIKVTYYKVKNLNSKKLRQT